MDMEMVLQETRKKKQLEDREQRMLKHLRKIDWRGKFCDCEGCEILFSYKEFDPIREQGGITWIKEESEKKKPWKLLQEKATDEKRIQAAREWRQNLEQQEEKVKKYVIKQEKWMEFNTQEKERSQQRRRDRAELEETLGYCTMEPSEEEDTLNTLREMEKEKTGARRKTGKQGKNPKEEENESTESEEEEIEGMINQMKLEEKELEKIKAERYLIIDVEATCDQKILQGIVQKDNPIPQEIIEIAAVVGRKHTMEVMGAFQRIVKPKVHPELTKFCKNLTGIKQKAVNKAEDFNKVMEDFEKWMEKVGINPENTTLMTCGRWDLFKMIPRQCQLSERPIPEVLKVDEDSLEKKQFINIKEKFIAYMDMQAPEWSKRNAVKMHFDIPEMLKQLGMEEKGNRHQALDDCFNLNKIMTELHRHESWQRFEDHIKSGKIVL